MKIDNLQNNVTTLPSHETPSHAGDKASGNAPDGVNDAVSLSSLTSRLRQMGKQTTSGDGIDLDRVNAIRLSIQNGSYQISSSGIVNGMVDHIARVLTPANT